MSYVYQCADPQRGPHNRCVHPVADPRGYRRCEGDPGCPVMLPRASRATLCFWHTDHTVVVSTIHDETEDLMGAKR